MTDSIREMLEDQLRHPEASIPKEEKQRLASYFEKWKQSKSISSLWRDIDSMFFPLFFGEEFYEGIYQAYEEDARMCMELLELIDSPFVLHEVMLGALCVRKNVAPILEILRQAPPVRNISDGTNAENGLFEDEINSIVAPTALDILFSSALQKDNRSALGGEVSDMDDVDLPLEAVCDALADRSDGFYLAYHYFKYLLRRERNSKGYYDVLNALAETFMDRAAGAFVRDGELIVEGLKDSGCGDAPLSDGVPFATTGELYACNLREGEFDGDVLLNYRAALWMIGTEEHEQLLFEAFKRVYACYAQSFFSNNIKFHLAHYDIGRVLIGQPDPADAWLEMKTRSTAALQRISYQYYGDQAMHIRSHHAFMQSVGLRMLDMYCGRASESGQTAKSVEKLWKTLWKEGLEYIRRYAKYLNDDECDYAAALICYYYVSFIKRDEPSEYRTNGSGKKTTDLAPLFAEIQEFPILCLMAIKMLDGNGMDCRALFEDDNGFYGGLIYRAQRLAEGQFKYQWVNVFLKGKSYMHTGRARNPQTPS